MIQLDRRAVVGWSGMDALGAIYGFICAIPDIDETAGSISLFSLHLLPYEVECVEMSREVSEGSETDVDQ